MGRRWRAGGGQSMLTARMRALRVLALFAAMLVAWPVAAFGGNPLLCRMMGRVVSSCCCGSAAHGTKKASAGAELRSRDCCEKIAQPNHEAIPAVRYTELRVDAPALVAVVPVVTALPVPRARTVGERPFLARAPPSDTPIFLKNCSLLS